MNICLSPNKFVPLQEIANVMRFRVFILGVGIMFSVLLNAGQYTVVIDAGHGGKDAGAVGSYLKVLEKNLNLEVSLMLASKIRTTYPEVNVVLTRSTDEFLPLQTRADIVNKNNADLFICIHTNSAESHSACGAETFILGTDRMEANLDVAMRENAVMKLEKDYQTTYQGFDPNSVDSYIMFELMQNQYMDQSLQFASQVQTRLVTDVKRDDRGVRQAAFWVLLKSACPSVLVEMGFISNKAEEQYLASDQGKREVTDAIFGAFGKYYAKKTGKEAPVATPPKAVEPAAPQKEATATPQPSTKPAPIVVKLPAPQDTVKKTSVKKDTVKTIVFIRKDSLYQSAPQEQQPSSTPQAPVKEPQEKTSQPVVFQPVVSPATAPVVYHVQIFAARNVVPDGDACFKGLKGCKHFVVNNWHKYTYGTFQTIEEAKAMQQELQQKFPGCFLVKEQNNTIVICK